MATRVLTSLRTEEPLDGVLTYFDEAQSPLVERTPTETPNTPKVRNVLDVDESVVAALPTPGSVVLGAEEHGQSLWGNTFKLTVQLPSGEQENYFLKAVKIGEIGRVMCRGEYESLKAIDQASPGFCPKPYAWGKYVKDDPETYFILEEFRVIGEQPANPENLGAGLAKLHHNSVSPTGKFGFHVQTCHGKIAQAVDVWDDSWCVVFKRHLGHIIDVAKPILDWPEFDVVANLTLEKVVPRLLLPLQSDGRSIKPCLVHGDCWDGNTATDNLTGEAFIFDVCSFYGHNEYDTGNWRAARHALSDKEYIKRYRSHSYPSEPREDWDARNLLYSLPFNIGNAIHIFASTQRPVIYEDMTTLCKMFCPEDLEQAMQELNKTRQAEDVAPEDPALTAQSQEGARGEAEDDGSVSDEEEKEEEEEEELVD